MKYRKGHIFGVPVAAGQAALGQVIAPLGSNVLAMFFRETTKSEAPDLSAANLDSPALFAETMDFKLVEGAWPILGWRELSVSIRLPEYKVWVEPPGEYRLQGVDGTIGSVAVPVELADKLRRQKSYAPALIEAALQALQGLRPWLPAFDEIVFSPE